MSEDCKSLNWYVSNYDGGNIGGEDYEVEVHQFKGLTQICARDRESLNQLKEFENCFDISPIFVHLSLMGEIHIYDSLDGVISEEF